MGRTKSEIITKNCKECNKMFAVPGTKRNINRKFCSTFCSKSNTGKGNKGRKSSDETRNKISKASTGKNNGFFGKKHTDAFKEKLSSERIGIRLTEAHKRKISKASHGENNGFFRKKHTEEAKMSMGRNVVGDNNPMFGQGFKLEKENNGSWRGGISFGDYGPAFNEVLKTKIRERDQFTCGVCFKNGHIVHHIDYTKENNDEMNLICTCSSCHGKINFNRNEWQTYFENIINEKYRKI